MFTTSNKVSILLLLLLSSNAINGQRLSTPKNQIKLAPFKLVDLVNPGVELSIERQIAKKFSTQLSYARMADLLNITPYTSYRGNRFGLEEKYFIYQQPTQSIYFSLELLYARVRYENEFSFGYTPPGVDTFLYKYSDTIHLRRTTTSQNLKIGYQLYTRHFVFDIALGLGLKQRSVVHSDRTAPLDEMESPRHPNAYYEAELERRSFTFNLPFVLKLGYCF